MHTSGDFPGGPVVETSSSSAGGAGSIPDGRAKIPHVPRPKKKKIKQKYIVTNLIKTLKKCIMHYLCILMDIISKISLKCSNPIPSPYLMRLHETRLVYC